MVSVVQVGACGYGAFHLDVLVNAPDDWPEFRIAGVVDPYAQKSPHYEYFVENSIPIFDTLDEYYAVLDADIAFISSPIHLHKPQTLTALSHGSHVMCEKPLSATTQDVRFLGIAAKEKNRFLAVGFQWSFSDTMQNLKRDILLGRFGKPKKLKALLNWPRDWAYFSRNSWAGKLSVDDRGEKVWVLDSIMNNATAHYLHNMLFVLGNTMRESAMPDSIMAEVYRANDIENYDTCALRADCGGVEVLYLASHAENGKHETLFSYIFENAIVELDDSKSPNVTARFSDGTVIDYGEPDITSKFKQCLEAVQTGDYENLACTTDTVLPHAVCVSAVSDNYKIIDFPAEMRVIDNERRITYVPGLDAMLSRCFDDGIMPHEAGFSWAVGQKSVLCGRDYEFSGKNI